jgi:RNA polymerase sigma factor (sigma-70 family)
MAQKTVNDYVELIETVARVECNRLSSHMVDYNELVNIGALAVHTLLTANPDSEFNISYLSTAIKWAIRNELRRRYKWYTLKQTKEASEGEEAEQQAKIREAVYETILSVDEMADAENPMELKDDSSTPEENLELNELNKAIRKAITKLPPREKMVLEMRFFKGKKMREIADELKISSSRVSRIVQAGLDRVKNDLKRQGLIEAPDS